MKTLVTIPCMDMVHTQFMGSVLNMRKVGDVDFAFTECSLIYDARNHLAQKAVEDGYDRILWLDSDMTFDPDLMERLSARLDTGIQFVSGLYFTRKEPVVPVIYREMGLKDIDGEKMLVCKNYSDYPEGLFLIAASGFGCVMMTTDLVYNIAVRFGPPFSPILGFGEDLSFCTKAIRTGAELYCDSTVKLGHVGYKKFDESDYLR